MIVMNYLIIIIIFAILAKVFLASWVYLDAKSNDNNPVIWLILILFLSSPIIFLVYIFASKKTRQNKCMYCGNTQNYEYKYCGNCGQIIEEDDSNYKTQSKNNILLYLGIIFLTITILVGFIFIINTNTINFENMPVSLISIKSKYSNKWNESFKYKNGNFNNTFKIKDNNYIDINLDIDDGDFYGELKYEDKVIDKFDSKKKKKIQETIDISKYKNKNIKLNLNFEKASGKIKVEIRK